MKKIVPFLFILLSFNIFLAQNAADIETSYGSTPGFNGVIKVTAQQSDGKILIGGNFTEYKGKTCRYFVRLLPDGNIDTSFNLETTIWYGVTSLLIQPDGKILVGGGYTTPVNGSKVGIIRINEDGSTDYSFDTMQKFVGVAIINDLHLQPDGKIIMVGEFDAYDSVSRKKIVRINSDGSLDESFNPGTGFNSSVNSIAVQTNGKMTVVGSFSNYNGYTRNKIIRLNEDGSVDLTFSVGVGFGSGDPSNILVQPDGKIVVVGNFLTYKNVSQKHIVRLLDNGDKDTTFDYGVGFVTYGSGLSDLVMDSSGNFYVCGYFTHYNNINKNNCVRLSSNGTLDTSFTIYNPLPINSILIQNDNKILLGGDTYIARVGNDSSVDYTFDYGRGFNAYVRDTVIQPDGKILVGGYFSLYNLRSENGLIRLNPDGTKDNTFNTSYLDRCYIKKLILQPDGKIFACGDFHYADNSTNYFKFIRFNPDGSHDTSFNSPSFYDENFALQSDGKIVCESGFTVRRLNQNGTVDNTFNVGSGFDYNVKAVAVQNDGKIIVVGDFSLFNGQQHIRIVRLLPNGSLDTTFNTGEGFNGSPYTISIQPDGKILVGGSFGSYNVISAWGIVRLNTDGSHDATFNPGFSINSVRSIVIQPDGKIIAGGSKTFFVDHYLTNLIRFNSDGSIDNTFDIETGFDNGTVGSTITKINLQSDNKIIISGNFRTYQTVSSANFVRLYGGNSVLFNEDFTNTKITLFPNPTSDFINLKLPSDNLTYNYEIVDLTGKIIIQKTTFDSVIDAQSLTEGVYILKLSNQQEEYISKFVKK